MLARQFSQLSEEKSNHFSGNQLKNLFLALQGYELKLVVKSACEIEILNEIFL